MLTDRDLIKLLYQTGHFWNPDCPNCLNVGLNDLDRLTLSDQVAKDAVGSWQGFDANFRILSGLIHGRDIQPDGSVGPVTTTMMQIRRCAMPDFAPPNDAQFHYDDPDLQGAVESMRKFSAIGSGSFQVPGCDPQRPNRATEHSIVVNANVSSAPAEVLENWDAIVQLIQKWAGEKGLAVRYVKGGTRESTHYFEFAFLPGSTIGINYFPQGSTCNQVVYGKIDSGFRTSVVGHANLWGHEHIGHGIGLNHTRGGYMNSSLIIIDPFTLVGDPTEDDWDKFFGGEPIKDGPVIPSPGAGPEFIGELTGDHNAAGQIAIRGVIDVLVKAGVKPGKYPQILVPSETLGRFHFEPKS